MNREERWASLTVRPYQLLCVICAAGEGDAAPRKGAACRSAQSLARGCAPTRIAQAVREDPDRPIMIACNAGDVYVYQDPGRREDTPEGDDFNRKRDLDILQRMNWAPGITLPARTAFMCLLNRITTVSGICGYDTVTSDDWKGCPSARSGSYERGHKKGIRAVIAPRTEEELAKEKERSLAALYSAEEVTIRPHILLCAVCQYGGGTRPPFKPDNLPELLEMILTKKPDIPIKLAEAADWMMCAPCPNRSPHFNACVNVLGSGGLSNQKRDLDMLQKLGLRYGSVMKARDLYRLIFDKIPTTQDICKRDNPCPSVWWDGCGEKNLKGGNGNYAKGRKELMAKLALG